MILNRGILVIAIFLLPGTDGIFAQAQTLTRMRVSYSSIGAASLATWVGTDAGIFNKHGLDVGLIYIGGGPRAMATTIANETQMTQGAGTGSILAKLGGADTVMVATILNTTPQSLMVIPEIRAPQDLRGKKLGVTRFGALSDFGVRKYLQKVGLDPEKDVTHPSARRPAGDSRCHTKRRHPGRRFVFAGADQSQAARLQRDDGSRRSRH